MTGTHSRSKREWPWLASTSSTATDRDVLPTDSLRGRRGDSQEQGGDEDGPGGRPDSPGPSRPHRGCTGPTRAGPGALTTAVSPRPAWPPGHRAILEGVAGRTMAPKTPKSWDLCVRPCLGKGLAGVAR